MSPYRVLVLLTNDSPEKWPDTIEALSPLSHESIYTTGQELSFAIHTLLELSKPVPDFDIDHYQLDYVGVILIYPSAEEFKSRYMLTNMLDLPEMKGCMRFSEEDQMMATMINEKYTEISNSLSIHEEDLATWSDDEPAALKQQVINATEAHKRQLRLLAALARKLKSELVNIFA